VVFFAWNPVGVVAQPSAEQQADILTEAKKKQGMTVKAPRP
jgi:hypothetical protein